MMMQRVRLMFIRPEVLSKYVLYIRVFTELPGSSMAAKIIFMKAYNPGRIFVYQTQIM
jgi:hypothetical protein